MSFVPVRKFGDKIRKTEFNFIDRKPVVDRYVQRRLEKIAKKKEELEKAKILKK